LDLDFHLDLDLDLDWDWDANVHVDSDWSGHESMTRNVMEWQPDMSHVTCRMPHAASRMPHAECRMPDGATHMSRVALPGWLATRDTWHMARGT
jgi:hypothetical protein